MTAEENQTFIIELLQSYGWKDDGTTFSQTYKVITHQSYPLAGGIVTTGGKPRLVSPNGTMKVGVGKNTTYFYVPEPGKEYWQWQGWSFKTRDREAIQQFVLDEWMRREKPT